ncbi:MaoC/PaaZ C-terminal domain-containing protein [Sulfoacidibacillus thermotolerans]|uniref:Dehydratase n=1 Tax=Sulfoacidibacillus thermotolerans TaxID=1765684 RepID=A0A2U3DBP3_SULT2|nr:MaoC/PaaZ C-terminal domain-containing protein [Sulfoacidibacillus thermotolerans]PWI58697.1 dehydratase [Sulfoacidibacillus thermotolerans]
MFYKPYGEYTIGDTWTSFGRTITESDVVSFAGLSGDFFSLHMDEEYARTTQFGRRIAHGMLVLSISTGLLHFEPGVIAAFYGIDHLRFTTPTFIGDTIHVEETVIDVQDRGERQGVVTTKHNILKQTGETVIRAEFKLLLNRA